MCSAGLALARVPVLVMAAAAAAKRANLQGFRSAEAPCLSGWNTRNTSRKGPRSRRASHMRSGLAANSACGPGSQESSGAGVMFRSPAESARAHCPGCNSLQHLAFALIDTFYYRIHVMPFDLEFVSLLVQSCRAVGDVRQDEGR